uniref:Glycosyl hydrolase n=1 Tax=Marinobacter nauticus TaxID=2743 RepID=A0A455VZV2_MARNT|nr:glycosyl hydrolase [Marinobacter nauticus]
MDTNRDAAVDLSSILVVIPAHNEEGSVGAVIRRLTDQGLTAIRVVDNACTDHTAERAAEAGAKVVVEPKLGYGMACWRGLQDIPDHIEWVLFCDADGCDDIEAWPQFHSAALSGCDFVLANRLASPNSYRHLTFAQRFGNRLATGLIAVFWKDRFHDLGPMRLIRLDQLDRINMRSRGFGWTVEMQVRVAELSIMWREIPVTYRPRKYGKSKISGTVKGVVLAGVVILSTIAKHSFRGRIWPKDVPGKNLSPQSSGTSFDE